MMTKNTIIIKYKKWFKWNKHMKQTNFKLFIKTFTFNA